MPRARRLSRFLSQLFQPSAPRRSERSSARRLFLETLEDRRVMATIGSSFDAGTGTLTLTGTDAAADTLNISLAGATLSLGTTAGNTIDLTSIGLLDAVGPQAVTLGAAPLVSRVVIDLRGEGDTINVAGSAATPLLTHLEINDTGADATDDAVNVTAAIDFGGPLLVGRVELMTLAANVTTTGVQTYGGNVSLTADVVLAAGGIGVTFNGTVVGNSNDLSITGNAVFGDGAADTVTGVEVLAVSGTTSINTSTITTGGTQTFTGAVTVGPTAGTATLTTSNDAVVFSGATTLNSNLTVNAGTADITFTGTVNGGFALIANSTGTTTFSAAVGGVAPLAGLTTNAGGTTAINGNSVSTGGGAQTYHDNVTLGADTQLTASSVTFNGTIVGNGNDLGITGNAVFGDAATDTVTGVAVLSVSGTTAINTNTVTTTGTQTYTGAATIGATAGTATLTSTNTAVLFGSTLNLNSNLVVEAGTGAITFTGAVNGGFALTANSTGATTFATAVGNTTPLASLTTNAGGTTALNGSTVNTGAGAQTYHDNVTLGADTLLTASTVTFHGTIGGNGNDLVITGNAVFGDAAADTVTGVDVLSVSGTTTINTNTVSTTGTQTYTGALTIGAAAGTATLTTTGDAVLAGSTTTLASNLTIEAGAGSITFTGVVNGGFALIANSTTATTFTSTVGATTPLASLTTNAGGTTALNGGGATTVSTTSAQSYGDPVTIGNHTVLLGGAGNIAFDSTVNGAFDLSTTAAGTTTINGAVGGGTALRNLDINPGGTTQLRNDVTTTQNQNYGNAVAVSNATTHLVTLTGNNITLEATASMNGGAAGESVKMVATANISVGGPVGNTQPLDKLTLQAGTATTQTAAMRGSGLELLGAGTVTLIHADNDFGTLAGAIGGTVQYNDATALTIGTVNATAGLSAAAITVTTGGQLTVAADAVAAGTVQLTASEAAAVDVNNVVVNSGATVRSTANAVTVRAGDHITVAGTVQAATTLDLLSIDAADTPDAGAGGVTGTVFTVSGALIAPQINLTGAAQNDVFNIAFALISGPVVVRGAANDATLAPGVVRDTGAADVPAITKNSKAPYFLPKLKSFVIGDQLLVDDNGATQMANFNRDYTIDGLTIRRVGDAAPFITFPDHDFELLKLTTGRGNNDVTVNLATGGALPEIVQVDTAGAQIGAADDRFQIRGTAGADKISIGDINLHASLNSPSLGPIRAHFELNGFPRQWIQSVAGDDVIDNISSVPGLLDSGAGKDVINSIVNRASSFTLAKKIENSVPNNVTLVLGNEDADKLFVGSGAIDNGVAATPLINALRNFPDRSITFLLGDQFVQGNILKDVPVAKQKGDNYASSATAFQHGFVAKNDFSDPAPAPNASLGLFRFGAGDKVKFSKTIAWLKAQLFVGAAVPLLLKSLNKQVQQYVRPVTDASGEAAPLLDASEVGPSPLVVDARVDVNRDGYLTASDALTLINSLNAGGARRLTAAELAEGEDETSESDAGLTPTLDVNGDENLTALDALLVINVLNAFGPTTPDSSAATDEVFEELADDEVDLYTTTSGEPVVTTPATSTALTAEAILSLLASDGAAQRRRQQAAT